MGANVGLEQDGKGPDFLRPVIILRKFNHDIFWAVPLTKSNKSLSDRVGVYYFEFSFVPGIQSRAILSQVRLIDGRRLGYKVGTLPISEYSVLKEKFKALIP